MSDRRHILIVDDSPEDREAILNALRKDALIRHRFTEAQTGAEGLRCYHEHADDIQLLVLDWRLPDMTAPEFIAALPKKDGLPPVPIVLLTGSIPIRDPSIIQCGVQDFFSKDLLSPELLARVTRNAIDRFELMRRLTRSERAAESARMQAEQANRAKSQFLTAISHELRTPLTAILGLTELLDERTSDQESQEMLDMMLSSGRHLSRLLDDLIDLAKVESGTLEVELIECDFHELVASTCELMRFRAHDKGLLLTYRISPDVPKYLLTDSVRVRQVLSNLLGNAIKFTDHGDIRVTVDYRRSRKRNDLTIWVADTGTGISSEMVDRIFTPFVQVAAQADRRRMGIGLGLAISRHLAHRLGGDLVLESTSPQGSTFRATFTADEVPGRPVHESHNGDAEAVPFNAREFEWIGKRVLLVEDTPANQFLIRRILEPTQANVQVTNDGEEALQTVRGYNASHFDVILMDMQMPIRDGYSAVQEIRRLGNCTPIIALTAAAVQDDRQRCLDAGCDDIVTKPIDRQRLFRTIQKFIGPSNDTL